MGQNWFSIHEDTKSTNVVKMGMSTSSNLRQRGSKNWKKKNRARDLVGERRERRKICGGGQRRRRWSGCGKDDRNKWRKNINKKKPQTGHSTQMRDTRSEQQKQKLGKLRRAQKIAIQRVAADPKKSFSLHFSLLLAPNAGFSIHGFPTSLGLLFLFH